MVQIYFVWIKMIGDSENSYKSDKLKWVQRSEKLCYTSKQRKSPSTLDSESFLVEQTQQEASQILWLC